MYNYPYPETLLTKTQHQIRLQYAELLTGHKQLPAMFYSATVIVLTESGLLLPVDVSAVNQQLTDDDDLYCCSGGVEYVAYRFNRNRHRIVLPRHAAIHQSTIISFWYDDDMARNLREWWHWCGNSISSISAPYCAQPPCRLHIALSYTRARLIKPGLSAKLSRGDCLMSSSPFADASWLNRSRTDLDNQYKKYALGCFGEATYKVSEPPLKAYREDLLEFYGHHEYGFFNLGAIYDCLKQEPTKPEL